MFPVGYSNDILAKDLNLIEAMPVKNVPLMIKGGAAHLDDPTPPTLPPDFSNRKKWTCKDENLKAENGAVVKDRGGANSRVTKMKVQPWREYHVSVRMKTEDFQGQPEIKLWAGKRVAYP